MSFCSMITEMIEKKGDMSMSSEVRIAGFKTGLQLDKD